MTLADIYFRTWDQLIENEIRRALVQILAACGTEVETARLTGWKLPTVKRLLRLRPLEELPGRPVFLLTPDHLRRYSYAQAKVMTKRAVVSALQARFTSMRAVARFIYKDDKYLGWLMARENESA